MVQIEVPDAGSAEELPSEIRFVCRTVRRLAAGPL